MTKPTLLRLVPLNIPIDFGMVHSNASTEPAVNYQLGLDERGNMYLIYRHMWPSVQANRPRLSVRDPRWTAWTGLRYVEWAV